MTSSKFKGFRPGVRETRANRRTSLSDLVEAELAKPPVRAASPLLSAIELIELGAVYVDDARSLRADRIVNEGSSLRIHTEPRRFAKPQDIASRILAEDQDSLLAEKPAGLPVEPSVDNVRENFVAFLEDLRGQNLFLVHRLAPESDGLLLLAKSQNTAASFSRAFVEGRVRRLIAAYVETPVVLGDHELQDAEIRVLACEERREATGLISEGRVTWLVEGEPLKKHYRIELEFTNARPKDLRTYLARIGSVVIGDTALGAKRTLIDSETGKSAIAFRAISLSVPR